MVNDELASTIDILPTFAKITNSKNKSKRYIDGKDISSLMTSASAKSPRELFIGTQAVIDGEWKYRFYKNYTSGTKKAVSKGILINIRKR